MKKIDVGDIGFVVCLLILICFIVLEFLVPSWVEKNGEQYSEIMEIATLDDGSYYIERTDTPQQKQVNPSLTVFIDGEPCPVDKVLYKNMDDTEVLCTLEGYIYNDDGDKYAPMDTLVLTIDPDYAKVHDLLPYK